ncbi:DUF2027 domain-containing protein [Fulvivirgaceae bacterium BMA12]|uniref:DUF2027 domain-containing protein n=1 Tax=Agaribacillus aureus TaxID=3051825 RepID=A0ABT8L351_9BACT|nr:DUF2027 domain-containing protein [Fulvivirgaceae bacterium BMA12]
MNIGDRVRLLKGKEEGVISKIVNDKLIEVEIEDGFNIPVLKKEVVIISQQEASAFGATSEINPTPKKTHKLPEDTKGVYLALVPINDKQLSLHFINNTELVILFTLCVPAGDTYEGYFGGEVTSKKSVKISNLDKTNFEQWPAFILQLLRFRQGVFHLKEPIQKKIKFKAASLFKSKKLAPVLMQEAYLYEIDLTQTIQPLQAKKLENHLLESQKHSPGDKENRPFSSPVVDLHIEKISKDHELLSGLEILNAQIQKINETLNEAIISGQEEIIYIHGQGNGTLKSALHKRLREFPNLIYFDNHNMAKFGNGATLVRIK